RNHGEDIATVPPDDHRLCEPLAADVLGGRGLHGGKGRRMGIQLVGDIPNFELLCDGIHGEILTFSIRAAGAAPLGFSCCSSSSWPDRERTRGRPSAPEIQLSRKPGAAQAHTTRSTPRIPMTRPAGSITTVTPMPSPRIIRIQPAS